jgi:hypothetical protein
VSLLVLSSEIEDRGEVELTTGESTNRLSTLNDIILILQIVLLTTFLELLFYNLPVLFIYSLLNKLFYFRRNYTMLYSRMIPPVLLKC